MIAQDIQYSPKFEISIAVRDKNGKEVGRRDYFTDDATDLCQWYERNAAVIIREGNVVQAVGGKKKRRQVKKADNNTDKS